jgi:protein SCO1/2
MLAGMALAGAAAAGGFAAYAMLESRPPAPHFNAVDVTGAPWGRGFELTDHNGKTRTLADFRGKVVMLGESVTIAHDVRVLLQEAAG